MPPICRRCCNDRSDNPNPDEIRDLQPPDAGEVLSRDGRNLPSVLNLVSSQSLSAKAQIVELLSKVVPGVVDMAAKHLGKKETREFRQKVGENEAPWRFLAENILAVTNRNGETLIGPVDEAGRSAIQDRLFTAGELLRLNQLTPDLDAVDRIPEPRSWFDGLGSPRHPRARFPTGQTR